MIQNNRYFYGSGGEAKIGARFLYDENKENITGVSIYAQEGEYEDVFFPTNEQIKDIQKVFSEYLQQKCMQKVKTH